TLANAVQGNAYAERIRTTGGVAPVTLSIVAGALPPGLTMDSDGSIVGTPAAMGMFDFTVRATDSCDPPSTTEQLFQINVQSQGSCPALDIETGSLPDARVDSGYGAQVVAVGGVGPLTFDVSSGQLPPGLSIVSGTGFIQGVPSAPGLFPFDVRVVDSCVPPQTAITELVIEVVEAPTCDTLYFGTSGLGNGSVGVFYSQNVTLGGGTPPYGLTITAGDLPPGLFLRPGAAPESFTIDGNPTAVGRFTFTLQGNDSCPDGSQFADRQFTIDIRDGSCDALGFEHVDPPDGPQGQPYSYQFTAVGQGTVTFAVTSGALPPGLNLDQATGLLSGTPGTPGAFTFQIAATDSCNPPQEVRSFVQIEITF
ncbi:MAG TPA: Ig domain-containing protein, partial [bacterium]|nr:Ig domain-containing protein [bacterium]